MLKKIAAAALVAAATTTMAAPAFASAGGCNDRSCIEVDGSGLRVNSILARTTYGDRFYGHFHIYGGGIDINSVTQSWGFSGFKIYPGRDLPNGSVLCVEGWEKTDSGHNLIGRPCVEVHF
ncbi:hypothetical protein PV458_08145 [Streptomyces sp. MN03-5084-2B]|nr:hypothetical protein [Streptomyces sp. MN03-5084-2B]